MKGRERGRKATEAIEGRGMRDGEMEEKRGMVGSHIIGSGGGVFGGIH